jgi:hypothetical protein
MRQGWKGAALAALACTVLGSAAPPAPDAHAAASKRDGKATAESSTQRNTLRQFTGYVTAIDKTSITVEKRGKAPQTRTFLRDETTKSVGDIAKETRVTVHYRQEGDQLIARRVEARPLKRASRPDSR